MDDNLYDEFGNYIGPELADSSEEESESEEEEEEEDEEENDQEEVRFRPDMMVQCGSFFMMKSGSFCSYVETEQKRSPLMSVMVW